MVPLAAALSIPLTTASGAALPQRDLVVVVAAAAIVCSLLIRRLHPGTTGPRHRARPGPHHRARARRITARVQLAEAALARLDELADSNAAPDAVIDRLRGQPPGPHRQHPCPHRPRPGTRNRKKLTERQLRADLIAAENAELARLGDNGTISSTTRQRLQQSLDLELARLTDPHR